MIRFLKKKLKIITSQGKGAFILFTVFINTHQDQFWTITIHILACVIQ